MAFKSLRPCRHPGCTALVLGGYCAKHRPKETRSEESRAWRGWYQLPVWKDDLRPAQLLRAPFCRVCAARRLRVRATDVDHVTPHNGDWAKFVDRTNLQSLCHACHSAKTIRESRGKRGER